MNDIMDGFGILILTHGRPDNVKTVMTLKRTGYTGRWWLVVDDEDKTVDEYIANFGRDRVRIFSKEQIAQTFDEADNFSDRRAVVYARNASFGIAEELGLHTFMQLDDDTINIGYKMNGQLQWTQKTCRNIMYMLEALVVYMAETPALSTVTIGQDGDFIGGRLNRILTDHHRQRKAMNTFVCRTDRRFTFVGRINEDVNTYTHGQATGRVLMIMWPYMYIKQVQTQAAAGGMSDIYHASGTYVKSFYTVMMQPSSVYVYPMGFVNPRLHHRVNWKNTVPYILREEHRRV